MSNGPHISIPIMQVLYGVLHAIEDSKKFSFLSSLLRQAIDGIESQNAMVEQMQADQYKMEDKIAKLKKLVGSPPSAWTELDRNWVNRLTSGS